MIDERELREMLERRAGTISATPTDAPKAIRRARRRLVLNATVGTLVGLAVLAGAFAGLRAIQAAPTPADPPAPTPGRLGSLTYGFDDDIYVADWDGSNPVRIADGHPPTGPPGCGPAEYGGVGSIWSPDGRYLAYRHSNCDVPRTPAWWDVVISDPEGNVVASFPSEGWLISWSPDSTRVAVWVRLWERIGIYGLDGERQAVLTVPPGMMPTAPWPGNGRGAFDPVWLPDGASLMVPYGVEIPLDGSTPRKLPWADAHEGEATYSPDGSRVAYVEGLVPLGGQDHQGGSFVVAAADGSHAQEVFGARAFEPVWSPTGDRIAFISGNGTELRVVDVASGTVTLLAETDGSDYLSVLDFSPEGDRILFSRTDGGGYGSLWSFRADGSDLRRLVTGTYWGDWRP
jgi:Tol biopolymer transport system component